MQAVAEDTDMVNRLKRLANFVRINWPLQSLKVIQSCKKRFKKLKLAGRAELTTQGKSVQSLTDDPIGFSVVDIVPMEEVIAEVEKSQIQEIIETWQDNQYKKLSFTKMNRLLVDLPKNADSYEFRLLLGDNLLNVIIRECNEYAQSGFDKQKKKVKRDKFLESQTGALVKFLKPIGEEVDDHDVTQTHDDVSNEITPSTSSIHGQRTNSDINESLDDQTTVGSISVDTTPAPVKTIPRTTESCNPVNSTGGFELLSDAYDSALWSNLLTHSQFDEIVEKGPLQ
ncbi:hypothetical protein Trydic_g15407, partial [Trypoxylus dichotomus]